MSFLDNIDSALEAQTKSDELTSNSDKYDPEVGDVLKAVLLKAELVTSTDYEDNIAITFRNVGDETVGGVKAGESGRTFTPTVLRRKMIEQAPSIGSTFALVYLGVPQGKRYKDWTLTCEGAATDNEELQDRSLWARITPHATQTRVPRQAPSQPSDDSDWKW